MKKKQNEKDIFNGWLSLTEDQKDIIISKNNKKDEHKGHIRGYHRTTKAWYYDALKTSEIEVLFDSEDRGTSGEMSMKWEILGNKLTPRLKSFNDSWSVLALFTDVIQELGKVDGLNISEEQFCKILDSCGFKDLTKYKKQ